MHMSFPLHEAHEPLEDGRIASSHGQENAISIGKQLLTWLGVVSER